jgi:hypothetical protein
MLFGPSFLEQSPLLLDLLHHDLPRPATDSRTTVTVLRSPFPGNPPHLCSRESRLVYAATALPHPPLDPDRSQVRFVRLYIVFRGVMQSSARLLAALTRRRATRPRVRAGQPGSRQCQPRASERLEGRGLASVEVAAGVLSTAAVHPSVVLRSPPATGRRGGRLRARGRSRCAQE